MAGSKIKLFQFFQKCHQIYGIHPNQKQHSNNSIQTIFVIGLAEVVFTTVAFIVFEAKSMFDYGFVFYILITAMTSIVFYLIFIWRSENTLQFIAKCDRFIESRSDSAAAFNELIGKIELFNKYFCFAICTSITLLFFSAVPYTFIRYFIFNQGKNSFYLFSPAWFPFDWKTPVGYLVAWLAQCTGAMISGIIVIQFLNLLFGSCWLFIFIAEDITQDVTAFNTATKTKSNENRTELTKHFCNMVRTYSDAKQCVMDFNRTIKYSLFVFFAWEMLGVSSLLITIQFQLWAEDSNLFEILLLSLILIWMILFIFLLCEPGARITNQFDEFNGEFNRCDWQLLSIELQRMYLTFLLDTQNSIKVMSYANITSERETSKKIIRNIFSYFMTLRKFKL